MEIIKYSEVIGKKFDREGNPLNIPGNTFLCFVHMDNTIGKHIKIINSILDSTHFYKKYIRLPESSYHMTVIEGVIPAFSDSVWTTKFPKECPLGTIDDYFSKQYRLAEKPNIITMNCSGINVSEHGCSLKLIPQDEGVSRGIKKFRADIAKSCGLLFPNHDTYQFHMTLAYLREKLNEDEIKEQAKVINQIERYIAKHIQVIELPQPQLTFFDNMFEFRVRR